MAQQVKFYSTSTFASTQNAGGIYFVGSNAGVAGAAGEIYKGTQRFGAARVTSVADTTARDGITGMIRGDIAICTSGGTFVYTGEQWKAIGSDTQELKKSWTTDITSAINNLNASFVGNESATTSIITGIKEENGVITAYAQAFPTLTTGTAAGEVALNGTSAKVSGWGDLVASVATNASNIAALKSESGDLESRVSAIEDIVDADENTVTANTGKFQNLTVTDTATFSATTLEATTLSVNDETTATFGGSTIAEIAEREALSKIAAIAEASATNTDDGVTVTATTSAGSITSVDVVVAGATLASEFTSTSTKVATAKGVKDYVDTKLTNINGAMRFVGTTSGDSVAADGTVTIGTVTKATGISGDYQNGDVVVSSTTAKEYIYVGDKWEEIGDEGTHALKAYTPGTETVTAGKTDLTDAVHAIAGAVDTLNAKTFTSDKTSDDNVGVEVEVKQASDGKLDDVIVTVTKDTLNTTLGTTNVADKTIATEIGTTGVDTALATEKAVRDAITSAELVWLDADGKAISATA